MLVQRDALFDTVDKTRLQVVEPVREPHHEHGQVARRLSGRARIARQHRLVELNLTGRTPGQVFPRLRSSEALDRAVGLPSGIGRVAGARLPDTAAISRSEIGRAPRGDGVGTEV